MADFDPTQAGDVEVDQSKYFPQTLTTGEEIAAGRQVGQQHPALENAAQAAIETIKGFVPHSLSEVLGFATPAYGGVEDIIKSGKTVRDVASGLPMQQAIEQNIPESQILKQAEQTAPYSRERFTAGFQTVAPLGLFAAVPLAETLFPKPKPTFDPIKAGDVPVNPKTAGVTIGPATTDEAMRPVSGEPVLPEASTPVEEVIPSATKEGQQPESYQPEYQGNAPSGTPAEAGGRGSVEPSAQKPPQEIAPVTADQSAAATPESAAAAPEIAPETAKPPFIEGTPEIGGQVAPEQPAASRRMTPTATEPIQVKPLTALKGVYQAAEEAGTAGYKRGFTEARAEGQSAIAQIKGELGMADRWLAGDQEQVRQNMVEFVNKTLPPSERGRFIGAITRALRRPPIQAGEVRSDPGMMYKNAFNVMKAIENRAEEVYRGGIISDIKGTLSKSLDAPGIDVAYRRQLKSVADSISTTKPTAETTARLQGLQDFVTRERAAGREPNIPQEQLDQLSLLSKLPLRDMPVNALEQLHGQVKNLVKLGRLKAKLLENLWEKNKSDMLGAMEKAPSNPIERRPLYTPQPTENLSLAQKFMNRVKSTLNGALRFEQAIAPMDEIYDHIGGGNGSYSTFPSKFIKGNLDLAENNKLAEFTPIRDQSAAIIKKYRLTKADMETVGVKGIVNMIGRERLEAMGVRGDILDRIEKTQLTNGQQAYYNFTRTTYDSLGTKVRDVAHRLYQQNMEIVDKYVPLLRDWAAHTEVAVPAAPADPLAGKIPYNETSTMEQLRRDFNPKLISRTEQGFIKSRIEGAKSPVELNAEEVFLRHTNDALHFIHQQPVVKMLAEVVRTPEFKAKYGDLAQKIVLDNLDSVATQGYVNHNQRIALIDWLRNSTSKGAVGFRIASNIVHSSQIGFEAVHAGGPGWWAKGLKTALSPEGQRFLRDNAAETYFRGGGEPAQAEVEAMSSIGRAGFYVARNIDKLGAQATFLGRYMKEMSKAGVPLDDILTTPVNQEARALALARMHRAVASPMAKDIPQMTSRGVGLGGNVSVARAINQFRNIFLDNWSNIRHDFLRTGIKQMNEVIGHLRKGELAAGAKLVGDAASHRAAIAAAALMGVAMETGIKMGVKKATTAGMQVATGTEPPKERKGHEEPSYFDEFRHHLVNRIPFVGQATSAYLYGESGIPVLDAVINPLKELGTAGKAKAPETQAKHYIRAAKSAATVAGIPGSSQAIELAEPKLTEKVGAVIPDRRKKREGSGAFIQ